MTDLPPRATLGDSRSRPLGGGAVWRLRPADVRTHAPQGPAGAPLVAP